jgi:predicted  nucleic acid-binding Zn-ribbon protein
MTDNEIIKALEQCEKQPYCDGCPYFAKIGCKKHLYQDALDLINRQKAEIERLGNEVKEKTEWIAFLKEQVMGFNNDYCELKEKFKTARAEAITEFAERLKAEVKTDYINGTKEHALAVITKIAKEVKGE